MSQIHRVLKLNELSIKWAMSKLKSNVFINRPSGWCKRSISTKRQPANWPNGVVKLGPLYGKRSSRWTGQNTERMAKKNWVIKILAAKTLNAGNGCRRIVTGCVDSWSGAGVIKSAQYKFDLLPFYRLLHRNLVLRRFLLML